jgi:hypothetical protein
MMGDRGGACEVPLAWPLTSRPSTIRPPRVRRDGLRCVSFEIF